MSDQERPGHQAPERAPTEEMVASWRLLMTLLARSMDVKVGLVTRLTGSEIEMTAPNHDQDYYAAGDRLTCEPSLLCERVITDQAELMVADSRIEAEWMDNPDARMGLLAYFGFPVYWPDGDVFGTICVLNDSPRDFSEADRRLLLSARDAIHDSLGVASTAPLLRDVQDSVKDGEAMGLWDYDPYGDRLRLSPSILRLYSLRETDNFSLEEWLRAFPFGDRARLRERVAAIAGGRVQTMSTSAVIPAPDGDVIIRLTARAIVGAEGRVTSIVGTHSVSGAPVLDQDERLFDEWFAVDRAGAIADCSTAMSDLLGPGKSLTLGSLLSTEVGKFTDAGGLLACVGGVASGNSVREIAVVQATPSAPPRVALLVPWVADETLIGVRITLLPRPQAAAEGLHPFFSRDPVTGLPTRSELEYRLQRSLERHRRAPAGSEVVMAIVELEDIGRIVQADGIEAADLLMAELADRVRGADRFVAALGFGYFAVLVHAFGQDVADRLSAALAEDIGTLPSTTDGTPRISISTVDVVEVAWSAPAHLLTELTRGVGAEPPAAHPDQSVDRSPLTRRQKEIASLVAQGMSNREIADALVIAVRTVEGHLDGIREKLDVTSRTQLVATVLTRPELITGKVASAR